MSKEIKLYKNQKTKKIVVVFPFSEARPTIMGEPYQVYQRLKAHLSILSKAERAIVLMNICSAFGEEVVDGET